MSPMSEYFSDLRSNIYVAASCLSSLRVFHEGLSKGIINIHKPQSPTEYFLRYSVFCWTVHCESAGLDGRQNEPLKTQFSEFLLKEDVGDAYKTWVTAINRVDCKPPDPLFTACKHGFDEVVTAVIQHRPWILNVPSEDYFQSCLHLAARSDYPTIIQKLVNAEVNINAKDRDGFTPLAVAIYYRRCSGATMKILLDKDGIDINTRDCTGRTPLSLAAGNKEISDMLLKRNADQGITDYLGRKHHWFAILHARYDPTLYRIGILEEVHLATELTKSLASCEFPCLPNTSFRPVIVVLCFMLAELDNGQPEGSVADELHMIFKNGIFHEDYQNGEYALVVTTIIKEFTNTKREWDSAQSFIQQQILQPLERLLTELKSNGYEIDSRLPPASKLVDWQFVWDYYQPDKRRSFEEFSDELDDELDDELGDELGDEFIIPRLDVEFEDFLESMSASF